MDSLEDLGLDLSKFYLGTLCKHNHEWHGTGLSRRRIANKGCVECKLKLTREWKARNRETVREYNATYYHATLEYQSERHKRYRLANPIKTKECARLSRERHKEHRLQHMRDWYAQNKERVGLYRKRYYAEKKDVIRAYNKRYNELNREAINQHLRKRYQDPLHRARVTANLKRREARKAGNHSAPYKPQQLLGRQKDFDNSCSYCGTQGKMTWDHFIPVKNGGCDALGNLVTACLSCNSSKNDRDPLTWYEKQPFFDKRRWQKILKVLGKTQHNYNQLPLL